MVKQKLYKIPSGVHNTLLVPLTTCTPPVWIEIVAYTFVHSATLAERTKARSLKVLQRSDADSLHVSIAEPSLLHCAPNTAPL